MDKSFESFEGFILSCVDVAGIGVRTSMTETPLRVPGCGPIFSVSAAASSYMIIFGQRMSRRDRIHFVFAKLVVYEHLPLIRAFLAISA